MTACEQVARILLKARPTPGQLADRLREPWADGLELYLDAADISGDGWEERLVQILGSYTVPSEFRWVVEGPLRSLDGTFFDVTLNTPANRELLRRLASFGRRIGAEMAVIHAISPTASATDFTGAKHDEMLERSLAILEYYAGICREAGIVPTVENVPPVTRMREARLMHSILGMEPGDLIFLVGRVQGLKITLDVSHAQLYINAFRARADQIETQLVPLVEYLSRRQGVTSLEDYISLVEDRVAEVHFSNARGLMEEGMAYGDGDLDLDWVVTRMSRAARFLVTETIEPDPERAHLMREAQARMTHTLAKGGSNG